MSAIFTGVSPLTLRLRELRLAAGMSQQALADAAGVRVATISEVERRTRPERIDVALVEKLAAALGCRPLDLIADASAPKPRHKR